MIESVRLAVTMTLLACHVVPVTAAEAPAPNRTTVEQSALAWSDLAPTERARAREWGLTATEWHRYRALMEGIRGSVSPSTISPVEVLGIHARDDSERQRYAEKWAVMMREDAERILAFQRAYDQAGRLLYPDERLIDLARLPSDSPDDPALIVTDRILLFVREDCAACDALVERLLARLDHVAGIDIYLSGVVAGDAQAVRDWAATHGVKPQWVTARRVTLNFEAGALAQLAPGQHELPYLMRRRGESVTHLSGSAL